MIHQHLINKRSANQTCLPNLKIDGNLLHRSNIHKDQNLDLAMNSQNRYHQKVHLKII